MKRVPSAAVRNTAWLVLAALILAVGMATLLGGR